MTNQDAANLVFLALCLWREARGESAQAQLGVAYVVLNRAAHPGWWGKDVQGVIFDKWQFSSLTAPHDPQLINWPTSYDPSWAQCLARAAEALAKTVVDPTMGATSYYDISIAAPEWAIPATFTTQIGRLRFHRSVAVPVAVRAPEKPSTCAPVRLSGPTQTAKP